MNLQLQIFQPRINNNIYDLARLNHKSYPKSPLRFPGGKARAVGIILSLIPQNIETLVSPFLGGGSVEIAAAHFGIKVYGYDVFSPLIDFWTELLNNSNRLTSMVEKYLPLSKDDFYKLQKKEPRNTLESAAIFYVLNRCSYSGSTLSGGMSPDHPRFTKSSIEYLKGFRCKNLIVKQEDFHVSIKSNDSSFMYLDPPYLIASALYGKKGNTHKDFDHEGLFNLIRKRKSWILSYNNCDEILDLYKNFRILYPTWKYGMSNDKSSREVLILSDDIPDLNG
jgi:DNA adenine methylase